MIQNLEEKKRDEQKRSTAMTKRKAHTHESKPGRVLPTKTVIRVAENGDCQKTTENEFKKE
jgi:hypothetical protein